MKGDVRRLEAELREYREQLSMADSARAATLAQLVDQAVQSHAATQRLLDSVTSEVRRLTFALGGLRGELTDVQRELVTVQELAGQSQTSLRELRAAIESAAGYAARTPRDSSPSHGVEEGPEQLFILARQQLTRGSPVTARDGFQQLIREYPGHLRVPDALRWIGESFLPGNPDSALVYFTRLVDEFPESLQAGSALYKIGLEAERQGDLDRAYSTFERVVVEYGASDAAALACQKLRESGRSVPTACRSDHQAK
ncbi:MAG: tetratricopeptide repeat protein [Gemmatimonadales bacterium]|nr:tetratricopeptide repeat protein [Gemmatimonadales bacterium]